MRPMNYLTRRSSNWIMVILPGAALILGGLIYVLLRPSEVLFLRLARSAGFEEAITLLRPANPGMTGLLPAWIIYSLPNACWAFSYALVITGIWIGRSHWIRYLWFATIPILVLGFEILQYPGFLPGTFSIVDLVAGLIGSSAGIFTGYTLKISTYENSRDS
jgi:hypothetical protein